MGDKEYIKDYFKKRAIENPDFYSKRPLLPIEAYIVDQILPASNVLDLCCGGGEISLAMAENNAIVTGVDYVPEMVGLAEQLFEKERMIGTFKIADATRLPFEDESFNYVVCAGSSLNSMTIEDAGLTMKESARVVVTGGTVYFAILNPLSLRSIAAVGKGILQQAPRWGFYTPNRGLFFVIPPNRMHQYMKESGLEYETMHFDIGFLGYQASFNLLIGHK